MIRIEITDFQSIEHVVLEVNGFAALVGRSNIGKSAVIRAVKAVLTNAQGTRDVRHGPDCARLLRDMKHCKCKARVQLTGPGYDILWEKGDADSRYTVNGALYEAVPKGFPEFLRPWFHPVRVGDESVMIQVADQFDPMFLLDASGPAVADVLSDVVKLDRINVASRLVEKDRRDATSTIKVRDKDLQRLHTDLSAYSSLDATLHHVEDVTSRSTGLLGQRDRVACLRDYVRQDQALRDQVAGLAAVVAEPVPAASRLKAATVAWEKLLRSRRDLSARQGAVDALLPIEAVPVPVAPGLEGALEASSGLLDWLAQLRSIKAAFGRLTPTQAATVPSADALRERHARLETLAPLAERLETGRTAKLRLETERKRLEAEEAKLHEDIRAHGACPVCDRPLEAAT